MSYEEQYIDNLKSILDKGKWVENQRTGVRCLTVPRIVMEYKLDEKSAPLLTTRPSYPISACAEILGYTRRYTWATQFDNIGSPTWYTNANETEAWLNNRFRLNDNHIGDCYGAALDEIHIREVFKKLEKGEDDRGLILNWWQPDSFERAALRPCMNEHQFSIIGGNLDLTSSQRSCDYLCGKNFNALQVYFLGMLAAKISGKEGGTALHIMKHVHIYEPHLEGVEELLSREPRGLDISFRINDWVTTYEDIKQEVHTREYFTLEGYKGVPEPKINFEIVA